jgi:Ca2+-transporting ATPase
MIYIFAYRSMRKPLFKMTPLTSNQPLIWAVISGIAVALIAFLIPGLREVLVITQLTWDEWLTVAGIAIGLLLVVELGKWANNKFSKPNQAV